MQFSQATVSLLGPWLFMFYSVRHLPTAIVRLIYERQWSKLFTWRQLRYEWFKSFWSWAGPQVARSSGKKAVIPLMTGRVRHGRILDESDSKDFFPAISGVVIDVGPGAGNWVPLFAKIGVAASSTASGTDSQAASSSSTGGGGITKVYGVEPNVAVHDALRKRASEAGLDGVYEIVPTGIENIASTGKVTKGEVDCVVTVLCLCGIPEPEFNIRELYGYLKPGGRMYIYEHVCCKRQWAVTPYQKLLNFFWPTFFGGCELCRDTGRYLREAGPWSSIDVEYLESEPWYEPIPHIIGVLTK